MAFGGESGGPPLVGEQLQAIRGQVLPRLALAGLVGGVWAQGSLIEGLSTDWVPDLDVVVMWASRVPGRRDLAGVVDAVPAPVAFDEPGCVLDRFFLGAGRSTSST